MRITYDPKVDALYIQFREGKSSHTREAQQGVLIDVDSEGRLYGIEILGLSQRMELKELGRISLDLPVGGAS